VEYYKNIPQFFSSKVRVICDILKSNKIDLVCLMCHNMGSFLLICFQVSDHLEQFGGVIFILVKFIILTDGGYPIRRKFHDFF